MKTVKDKWNAKDYAKNSSAQEKWAVELIEKLALDGNEKLLDIGCGDGKITYRLSRILNNGSVIGIDQSESMILESAEFSAILTLPDVGHNDR